MIEQAPPSWLYSKIGGTAFGAVWSVLKRSVPSKADQPKFAPLARRAGRESTSSQGVLADVADQRSPVARSNVKRHGLRSPYA